MQEKRKPNGYWTKERCEEESRKYETRQEFRRGCSSAFTKAVENEWIKDYSWLKTRKSPGYWNSFENVYNAAKEFTTVAEFNKTYPLAYRKARDNNWLKSFDWLINRNRVFLEADRYWSSEDHIIEAAGKCSTRTEFWKKNSRAYKEAKKLGLLDLLFPNYRYISNDKVDNIYIYKFEELNSIYVGRTIRPAIRDKEHRSDLFCDSVYKFSTNNNIEIPEMEIIESNITIMEGKVREDYWVEYYKSKGWNLINIAKAGSLGSLDFGKWDYSTCKKLASECTSRNDFSSKHYGAYSHCVRYRKQWLDEFFPCKSIKFRSVDQLDLDGNYLRTFSTQHEASRFIQSNNKLGYKIGLVCRGERKTAGGYKWRYHKEE